MISKKKSISFIFFILIWITTGCGAPRYNPYAIPDPLPSFYVPEEIRVALVLGSGGIRGLAHVGVLEELIAADIKIDLIVGCSAGSIVGAMYADNPNIESVKRSIWQLKSDSILDIDLWNCRYGLSQGKSLNRILDNDLVSETFEELKLPLVIVASDLHSGELVPIASGDLVKAVQASCSIPFFFVPCEYLGRVLVDGGVVNPVPVKVAYDLGADIVIAVDLCELLPQTFPTNLFGIASRSAEIAFTWLNESCTCQADIVLRPKMCGIGSFNDKMKLQVYEAGKLEAKKQLPEIKELIASKSFPQKLCEKTRLVHLDAYTPKIYLSSD